MASHQLRHVAGHLLTPLLMCVGMALAYLGAFHHPEPNHLKVAVVGEAPQVKVLAQTMKDTAGDRLEVVTLPGREAAVAQQLAEASLALATSLEAPFWGARSTFMRGLALTKQGFTAEGLEQMHRGWAAIETTGVRLNRVYFLARRAEALLHAGGAEDRIVGERSQRLERRIDAAEQRAQRVVLAKKGVKAALHLDAFAAF